MERPPRKPRPRPESTPASRRSSRVVVSRGSIISCQSLISSAGSETVGSRSSMRSSIRSRGTIVGPRETPTPSKAASEAQNKKERQGEEAAKAAVEQSREEKQEDEEEEAPLVLEPVLRPLILYLQRARHLDTLGLRDLTPPVDDHLVHDGGLAKALYVNSSIQRLQLDGNALTMKGGVDRLGEASSSSSNRRVTRPTLLAPPLT